METWQMVSPGTAIERLIFQISVLRDRQLFKTKSGHFGFGKRGVEKGDWLYVFNGAPVPYILKLAKHGKEKRFRLFGEAYVHGFMNGESDGKKYEDEDIVLV